MPTWKPVAAVFHGGTQQLTALKGKRVRTKSALLSARVYDPVHHSQTTTSIALGSIGFVANPLEDNILIAFAKQPSAQYASLEALSRGNAFIVIVVNAPTFKAQFDIEV
jgi:hypothetical protein